MADYGDLEDHLGDAEVGAPALLEDDDDDDFRPNLVGQDVLHEEEDDEDAFAAPAPAPAPARPPAEASPMDKKAKLLALADKKRREEAEGGKKKKGDKDGDKEGKKRKRDKEGKRGDKEGKGGKEGKKKQRPQRTPGGEGGAPAPRAARGPSDGNESEDSRDIREQDADRAFIDDEGEAGGEEEMLGSDILPDEEDADAEAARLAAAPEAMEGDEALDAEEDLFGRKKKKKQQSEQQMMEELNDCMAKMEAAAEADMEAHMAKKPALQKLRILKEVEQLLAQRKYHELFLHAGGLGTLKSWLEPYSDRTLPNVRIRTAVLGFCKMLPIDTTRDDVRENLKKSQLGSRVMFLAKCPDETQANRKLALDLVQRWARPIFFDPEAEAEKRRAKEEALKVARAQALDAQREREEQEERERVERNKIKAGERGYRWHAMIPQMLKLDYVVAPQTDPGLSSGGGLGGGESASQAGVGGKRDEGRFAKKMREVQRKQKGSTARAAVPSVEGRNIVL